MIFFCAYLSHYQRNEGFTTPSFFVEESNSLELILSFFSFSLRFLSANRQQRKVLSNMRLETECIHNHKCSNPSKNVQKWEKF